MEIFLGTNGNQKHTTFLRFKTLSDAVDAKIIKRFYNSNNRSV